MSSTPTQKTGKPRLDPTQRLLHRFYEPLVLLRILDPTRGKQASALMQSGASNLEETWHRFLDQLSWICDYEPGGDTVSSIAAQTTPDGPVFWLAANKDPALKALPHLLWVLEKLENSYEISPLEIEELEDEITTRCIEFGKNKVRNYGRRLRSITNKVAESFEEGSQHLGL